MRPVLTVFTPAYNRAHTLPETYLSLCRQDCRDFVWLVIDDGSSDGTGDLVRGWMEEGCGFEIRYIYKENGGMHTAHNTAYENIDTELNVCIDSDDRMAPGAVRRILDFWEIHRGDRSVAGIIGLDADLSGKVIGTAFEEGLSYTTLSGFYAGGGRGDKKLVYRTGIMKSLPPYPVFPGEKYGSLAYKYLLCDQEYRLAILNEVLCLVDYQPDGSTGTMFRQYLANPRGWAFTRKTDMLYPAGKRRLLMTGIHYCSSSIIARNIHFLSESPRKLLTLLCLPAGLALTEYIRFMDWKQRGRKGK